MKKIYIALFALLAVGSTFTACTEEEPFATVRFCAWFPRLPLTLI